MKKAKRGDTIQWTNTVNGPLKGIFKAKVAMVDNHNRQYGVYCEYGQDLIPFENATIIDE